MHHGEFNKIQDQLKRVLRTKETFSLIGLCKNAGKTTALNGLINAEISTAGALTLGLMSLGLDGETRDRGGNKEKPQIYVPEGSLFITQSALWRQNEVSQELMEILGPGGALGSFLLVKAHSEGNIQLSGPSSQAQVKKAVAVLKKYGAKRLLIDGSINRRVMENYEDGGVILCSAAFCFDKIEEAAEETLYLYNLLTNLPSEDSLNPSGFASFFFGQEERETFKAHHIQREGIDWKRFRESGADTLFFKGAITDRLLTSYSQVYDGNRSWRLVAANGSKILLNKKQWEYWQKRGLEIKVQKRFEISAVFLNQRDAYDMRLPNNDFLKAVASKVTCPVFDLKEGLVCNIPI